MWRGLAFGLVCVAMTAVAQSAPQGSAGAYDLVASVKPNKAVDGHLRIRMDAAEIFIEDASVKDLLSNVYGTRGSLILNVPKWAENERFDIRAKVLADDPAFFAHVTRAQRKEVFERLLRERFGVATHTETREMPVYELVRVGEGKGLVENPPPPAGAEPEPIKPGRSGRGNTSVLPGHLDATGVKIADLCANLARVLDRSVVDKTGLAGFYDIELNWNDERTDAVSDAPSLFAALPEQVGLKLVAAKGPVTVLVVDQASLPKQD
jgi:uncharacterized protein (TIGR03435 family)